MAVAPEFMKLFYRTRADDFVLLVHASVCHEACVLTGVQPEMRKANLDRKKKEKFTIATDDDADAAGKTTNIAQSNTPDIRAVDLSYRTSLHSNRR